MTANCLQSGCTYLAKKKYFQSKPKIGRIENPNVKELGIQPHPVSLQKIYHQADIDKLSACSSGLELRLIKIIKAVFASLTEVST